MHHEGGRGCGGDLGGAVVVESADMMQGEKDAENEHVFEISLELTSNDAFGVPPRREPVFFTERCQLIIHSLS